MRPRVGISLFTIATLLASLGLASLGAASQAGAPEPVRPQGAGLFDVLESLANGRSDLIAESGELEAFSPFGAPASDDTGQATLTDTFHFRTNIGDMAVFNDLDFDGSPDVTGDDLRRFGFDDADMTMPLNGPRLEVFDQFAPVMPTDGFEGGDMPWSGLDLAFDPMTPGTLFDRPVIGVPPPDGMFPTGVVDIWGGRIMGGLPVDGECDGQVHELGVTTLNMGGEAWPSPAAVYDLFGGASHAWVLRCDPYWHISHFVNGGSQFNQMPTSTVGLIFDDIFIGITDGSEMAGAMSHRSFAFRTPASGGYQPSNTIATSHPHVPEMSEANPPYLVGTPVMSAYDPLAFPVTHTLDGTNSGSCAEEWTTTYELYAGMQSDARSDALDVSLYQFDTGQLSFGIATLTDGLSIETTGDAPSYRERYMLGSEGSYDFFAGDLECNYTSTIDSSFLDDLQTGITTWFDDLVETGTDGSTDGGDDSTGSDSTGSDTDSTGSDSTGSDSTGSDSGTDGDGDGDSSDTATTDGSEPEGTTETEDDPIWPWISLITGVVIAVGGYFVSRTGGDDGGKDADGGTAPPPTTTTSGPTVATAAPVAEGPCDRIRRAYEAAKAEAEAKRAEAEQAETDANEAEQDATDARNDANEAGKNAEDAKNDRDKAERDRDRPPPNEDDTWIEDSETGERITSRDLRLRREAAGEAWDRYRDDPSQESAEQTEQDWEDLDEPGARDERREADDMDQAAKQKKLEDAEQALNDAEREMNEANEAADKAEQEARDARDAADKADQEADDAEARAAEWKRALDECLGLKDGPGTKWGGPMGTGEDCDGGCFPEGNVERRVIDTFSERVLINYWCTVMPDGAEGVHEGQRISGELAWYRDMFATGSAAISVGGAIKGTVSRGVGDAVEAGVSGGATVAGEKLGIDIPTSIFQVPVVALEGAAAVGSSIIGAFSRWIQRNHVSFRAEWGYVSQQCDLTWVAIWKCENGVMRCVEHILDVNMADPVIGGAQHSQNYTPADNVQRDVEGRTRTVANRVQKSSQRLVDFMQKHTVGPCDG
ncbi:MAG: hypothetical protein DHS20C19_12070 [Acidimicrobiales bacterium]|nr:MAG: hypothetical protein DHS20C19_12070 [Acidimicrobiales bacterium]